MNKNSKILPQLNQLFLQRQQISSHKRRIMQIKKKKPKLNIRQQFNNILNRSPTRQVSIRDSKVTLKSKSPQRNFKQLPPTIFEKYKSLGNSFDWMNPYRKKIQLQIQKQNSRWKSRIHTSKSQLGKNKLEKQYDKFAKIKQRLMKYQINPQSHKTVLKSQKSLNYVSPGSRISNVSQKKLSKNQSRRSAILSTQSQLRKQSNFSAFVKRSNEFNGQFPKKQSFQFKKIRPHINYISTQKNKYQYGKSMQRRLKTDSEGSCYKMQAIKIAKNTMNQNHRYFAITQVDI